MIDPTAAYFCMEFGLDAALPVYSGGLGILAGDVIKAAGDLEAPIVGVGILWDRGYTRQTLDKKRAPVDAYPETPRDALTATDARFSVSIAGEEIECTAYRVTRYTRGELYLIDPVEPAARRWTRNLYGGGPRDRVAQEILLGVGGIRLLRALGRPIDIYHFNEGHAVFAGLELIRERIKAGDTFAAAQRSVRDSIVFTTHTPVPAGNEEHPIKLLKEMGALDGIAQKDAIGLGGSPFSMTVAGLRLARNANGVAELHGETAREMWKGVSGAAPIVAITNGVHRGTWQDARVRAATSPAALAAAHAECKKELLAEISARTSTTFESESLVIGFARRAASYKRADLILRDPARLEALFARGVRLVFSGKAHPADKAGKALVTALATAAAKYAEIAFLEDYDMVLGAQLTRGCDVWLNNPQRPKEACGTSGMKAAMNGVLNLSILDGWWPEGCVHGENGWKIEAGPGPETKRDARDAVALYETLEAEVVPAFADKDRWLRMMSASIEMSAHRFSAARMVRDYIEKLYRRPEPTS